MAEDTRLDMQELQDKEAIKEMVVNYFYLSDEDDTSRAEYFTQDATTNIKGFDEAEGFQYIRHMLHMPLIDVDGDTASGKWYLDCPAITDDGEAIWIQGTYEHEFRRVDGEWKFSSFTFDPTYVTPYNQGWAEQAFVEDISKDPDW